MGKLSQEEIRRIVQKASLLQKYNEQKSSIEPDDSFTDLHSLFEVTDELNIGRNYVYEAFLEHSGIPVQEPLIIDNKDFHTAEVVGFTKGTLDGSLLNELRRQLEFHFNTMGNLSHRRNKIVWKAKPSGISRFIASSNSPEVEFIQQEQGTQIRVRQSLKTTHKLYLPNLFMFIVGFMMMAGGMFSQANDQAPLIIIGGLFVLGSYLFSRFVANRRSKKKKKLSDLTEVLQQSIERHLKSKILNKQKDEGDRGRIEIPEKEEAQVNDINNEGVGGTLENDLQD